MSRTLQIIFKVAERCNLNCSYCYYFNMEDTTPGARPALMSHGSVTDTVCFLEACLETGAYDQAIIVLHGGEPMLMPPKRARDALEAFSAANLHGTPIYFGIQTNATVISSDWLEVIADFNISVCVSLDGDQKTHDRFRLDKKGRPTHAQVEAGVRQLSAFAAEKRLPAVTLLAVAGASEAGDDAYAYFSESLGARHIDFILPDATHDAIDPAVARRAATFLERAFEQWIEDENRPTIAYFQEYVDSFLAMQRGGTDAPGEGAQKTPNIFTVYSDGRITGNDYVRSLLASEDASMPKVTEKLEDIFDHVSALEGFDQLDVLPRGCRDCRWRSACGGGQMLHRHSRAAGFDNPSVYCDHIKRMYARVEAAFQAHMAQA